jgi:hypothetical protein
LCQAKHDTFIIHNVTAEESLRPRAHQVAHRDAKGKMAGIHQQPGKRRRQRIAAAGDNADKHEFGGASQNQRGKGKGTHSGKP